MKTNNLKTLTLVLGFSALTLSNSLFAANTTGSDSGGGGDASEVRVNEIRSDILEWIKKGGAAAFKLPSRISYDEYVLTMSDILTAKKVVIGFVENDDEKNDELKVSVNGTAKTCRGFYSQTDLKPHILCNISRFEKTSESDQYVLIHHEYAGLVNVESNEGAASDYEISSQITKSLTEQTVLKLAVKTSSPPSPTPSLKAACYNTLRKHGFSLMSTFHLVCDNASAETITIIDWALSSGFKNSISLIYLAGQRFTKWTIPCFNLILTKTDFRRSDTLALLCREIPKREYFDLEYFITNNNINSMYGAAIAGLYAPTSLRSFLKICKEVNGENKCKEYQGW